MSARPVLGLLAAAALAGCAASGPVEPDGPVAAEHYHVEPGIEWSRVEVGRLELWTVDGPQLQQLRFYRALGDGDSLSPQPRADTDGRSRPRFRDWMRPHDVMELVADTLAQSGAVRPRAHDLRPAPFGDREGFRFGLDFVSQAGLEHRALALGMIDAERRLHLILYIGAQPHYFEAYRDEVEGIFESVTLVEE